MEQSQKIGKFLGLLDKSGACDLLNSLIKEKQKNDTDKGGRPTHNPYNMLALILFNFSFGKGTLRDIEDSCKYDIRCIYIMQDERPSHMTLSNFINGLITTYLVTQSRHDSDDFKILLDKHYEF